MNNFFKQFTRSRVTTAMELIGFVFVSVGIGFISLPIAFIVAGVLLITAGIMAA